MSNITHGFWNVHQHYSLGYYNNNITNKHLRAPNSTDVTYPSPRECRWQVTQLIDPDSLGAWTAEGHDGNSQY